MRHLLQRHFWVVNLAALAGLALLVAQTVNDQLAGSLFAVPELPSDGAASGLPPPGMSFIPKTDDGVSADLVDRPVFGTGPPEGSAPPPVKPPGDTPDSGDSSGDADRAPLPVDVLGTAPVEAKTELSTAVLRVEGDTQIAQVGTRLMDDKLEVVAIAPRHVLFRDESGLRTVALWDGKAKQPPKPAVGRPLRSRFDRHKRRARPQPRPRPKPKRSGHAGVKKMGPNSYTVDRQMMRQTIAQMGNGGLRGTRLVPKFRGGKYEGFQLRGISGGSPLRALGLRSGDLLTHVNGRKIDGPATLANLYDKLKDSSAIELGVSRAGRPRSLSYSIQ